MSGADASTGAAAAGTGEGGPAWLVRHAWLSAPTALAVILAAGGLLRLVHVLVASTDPVFDVLVLDHLAYDAWAQRIAAGELVGPAPYFVDPLYAYVLGGIYALLGRDLLVVRLLQVGLGVGTIALVARAARVTWGSKALANLAALLYALYVPSFHDVALVEKTALGTFLVAAAAAVLLERKRYGALAGGLLLGLGTLARGNVVVLVPAAALALLAGPTAIPRGRRRLDALLLTGAALLALGPAGLHNALAGGSPFSITTNVGSNLYIGHQAVNETGTYYPPAFVRPNPAYEEADFKAEAERRTGHALTPGEASAFWRAEAMRELAADLPATLGRMLRKATLLVHDAELPDNGSIDLARGRSFILWLPVLWMGLLFPLAVVGGLYGAGRREVRLVAGTAALLVATLLLFFVVGRLRAPIVPLLCVLAAGGVAALLRRPPTARSERRRFVMQAAVFVGGLVATHVEPAWLEELHARTLAVAFHNLGAQYAGAGRADDAIRAHERAVAIRESAVPASLASLVALYERRGELATARGFAERWVALRPDSGAARAALARVTGPGGAAPAAGGTRPAALDAQARAAAREGRHAEAIALLEQAVREGPYDEGQRYLLGGWLETHASPAELRRVFAGLLATDPKPQTSRYFLAVALDREGRTDEAIAELERALSVDPAHEMSEHRWGAILERRGDLEGARQHFERATEIHPDFRDAHLAAARVLDALGRSREASTHRAAAAEADPASPRRYLHWGRYLLRQGRAEAAAEELRRAVAALPSDAEATTLLAEALRQTGDRALGADARARLVSALRTAAPSPLWLATYEEDPRALALSTAIRGAFAEAGWELVRAERLTFRPRPGLYLFAATAEPPSYVETVRQALADAGLEVQFATGYRDHYEARRRDDPRYAGFPMGPEQDYVLAVGPIASHVEAP